MTSHGGQSARGRRGTGRVSLAVAGVACAAVLAGLPTQAAARSGLPGANGQIAFQSDRDGDDEIYVMDSAGGGQVARTNNVLIADTAPSWSPDGSRIAFVSTRDGDEEIYVMGADGNGQTRLTTNAADDLWPVWTTDGRKIAFQSVRDGNEEIYVMNIDGTNQTRLTNDPGVDIFPAWSPDSTRIAFTSTRDSDYEIYAMNIDGTNPTRLTTSTPFLDAQPTWSPDGSKIAFASNRDGNFNVYVMNSDGSNLLPLTDDAATDWRPAWSPDGTKIAFESNRGAGGDAEVYVMDSDGTSETPLTSDAGSDVAPTWQPLPNDLAAQASADPSTLSLGGQATYVFNVRNNGSASAPGTTLTVTQPQYMQVLSLSTTQGSCQVGVMIDCALGTLGAAGNVTVSFVTRAAGEGIATARGTVGIWGADANPANNAAEVGVSIVSPGAGVTPEISVRLTYPKGLRSGRTKRMKRRALYRAIARGFRGESQNATRLEAALVRKRGKRCRKLAKAKRTSCSKTSRRGMKVANASATSSTFRYRPLRSARRAKRALRAGRRLKRGRYELLVKAYPNTGDPKLFTFKIKSA